LRLDFQPVICVLLQNFHFVFQYVQHKALLSNNYLLLSFSLLTSLRNSGISDSVTWAEITRQNLTVETEDHL
jgi:hypothetical protein